MPRSRSAKVGNGTKKRGKRSAIASGLTLHPVPTAPGTASVDVASKSVPGAAARSPVVPASAAVGRPRSTSSDLPVVEGHDLHSVHRLVLAKYGQRPDVTGVDVGFRRKGGRWTEELVVRIHVREKHERRALHATDLFPRHVNGVAIDVVETSLSDQNERLQRRDPVQPGISLGAADGVAGTLGALMYDNLAQETCLLSAAHVLFPNASSAAGGQVVQPARSHGGIADGFASLTRFDGATDAAIARVETGPPGARLVLGAALGTVVEVQDVANPYHGQRLTKSGAGTGVTTAVVDGIGAYGGLSDAFTLLPIAGEAQVISRAGDSGAVWFDAVTGAAVGLHCQGPLDPAPGNSYAVASRFSRVMQNLQLSFVSFG